MGIDIDVSEEWGNKLMWTFDIHGLGAIYTRFTLREPRAY